MHTKESAKKRKKEIYEHITMVNIFSLFIVMSTLILGGNFFTGQIYSVLNFKIIIFLLINLVGFGIIILYINKDRAMRNTKGMSRSDLTYILFFLIGSSMTLVIETDRLFYVELILILPVIITSSIWGKKIGLVMAGVCTLVLLLNYQYQNSLDHFWKGFGDNLVLISIMFVVGWFVGAIADLETKYRAELTQLANTDALTGLHNHRFFQVKLKQCFKEASSQNPLSLILIDIDNFKNYNDSFGHLAGDNVLHKVAQILKNSLHDKGFVARYGGEEFVVVLENCEGEEALKLAEKIRIKIKEYDFLEGRYQPESRVTISSGITSFPTQAKNEKELIKFADQALYRAKSLNKNKVELYYSIFDSLEVEDDEKELLNSIRTLVSVINAKDRYTYGHSERVMEYSRRLAQKLNLSDIKIKTLTLAAFLHDIGKIEISRDVLNKKGKLNDGEWYQLQQHPLWGYEIVREVNKLKPVAEIILYHHEDYDGTGYPEGIKGESIPLLSRIIRIIDSYDAMTSNRPYKRIVSRAEALEELKRCSGTDFDPDLVENFVEMIELEEKQELLR